MKKLTLTLLTVIFTCSLFAAAPKVLFYGYVVEGDVETMFQKDGKITMLSEVDILVSVGDEYIKAIPNRKTGFYSIILEAGKKYTIRFEKAGYIAKSFEIDATSIPEEGFEESFKMLTDITLFPRNNYPQESTLSSAPVAKCHFNPSKGKMEWDMNYAKIAFDHFLRVTSAGQELVENK